MVTRNVLKPSPNHTGMPDTHCCILQYPSSAAGEAVCMLLVVGTVSEMQDLGNHTHPDCAQRHVVV